MGKHTRGDKSGGRSPKVKVHKATESKGCAVLAIGLLGGLVGALYGIVEGVKVMFS